MATSPPHALRDWFDDIDVYLFDQLLRGRLTPGMRILDAGCGGGRNLMYMLKAGFDVCGVDREAAAIAALHRRAVSMGPEPPKGNFLVEAVEALSFPDESFDGVLSIAVLHFAETEHHFDSMLDEMWRVLKPGGLFFGRLASSIGLEQGVRQLQGRRYHLPDGTERFLVDREMLTLAGRRLGGDLLDPIKTVNVDQQRCMTTWCMRKRDGSETRREGSSGSRDPRIPVPSA